MTSDREKVERQRFLALIAFRLGGLVFLGLGLVIAMSTLVRPGGWPALGAILAAIGAIDIAVLPRLLKAAWDRQDATGK